MSELERIHAICETIRVARWAGEDERKAQCEKCPAIVDTLYGPATRGCYLLALECFNIAAHGHPLGVRNGNV